MNSKTALWLPVLLGGATGALLAISSASSDGRAPSASSDRVASSPRVTETPVPSQQPSALPAASVPHDAARPLAPGAVPAESAPSPVPALSASTGTARVAPAFDLTPPNTREELAAIEMRCELKNPEDCERAARALESGKAVPRELGRASVLRRIALTLYVKQCETGRALACARLGEMYAAGEYVQPNPRGAEALRARVRDLCAQRPAQPGCAS